MAAPDTVTCTNLSGKYVMNKSLSDDIDAMLTLQGLSWLTRKAIGLATVVKDGVYHVDIVSVASGLSTTKEDRTLDFEDRDHNDKIFGKLRGRSRLIKGEEYERIIAGGTDEDSTFLKGLKLKDGKESKFLVDQLLQTYVKNVDGGNWVAEQVWGFEEINGERRHTRRVVCRKGDKVQRVRLVYDYKGSSDKKTEDDGLAYGES